MERSNILVILLVAIVGEAVMAAECDPITQMYYRAIQSAQYTWGFDGQTRGARYKDGSDVETEDVREGIEMAITLWTNAANGPGGTAITLTETVYSNAQLKIRFEDLGFACGQGDHENIKLNTGYPFDGASSLWSTIIHEMGHSFLGSGHHGNSGILSCAIDADCDKKVLSLSSEETARTLDLYNPPYSVTVKNDFGPAMNHGGSVTVDQVTYHNIPVAGKEFVWRTYQDTHTVTAVDYQEIPENSVVYLREYQRWRNELGDLMAERPVLSFNPPVVERTYTASFLKLFNVTFADAVFIEAGGSGGYYTVDGEPTTSTVIREDRSKLVAAVAPAGWIFVQWSDNHVDRYTNPRVLAPTDHVTGLFAIFKKHLGSSLSTATSGNNQRRLLYEESFFGKYTLAYPSGGEIWLSESSDGVTWSPEFRLSSGAGSFASPSLAISQGLALLGGEDETEGNPAGLYCVYTHQSGSNYSVLFRERRSDTWHDPIVRGTTTINTRPVVARTVIGEPAKAQVVLVWESTAGLRAREAIMWTNSWTWGSEYALTGSGYNNPSMSAAYIDQWQPRVYLTYDNGSNIYLRKHNTSAWESHQEVPASVGLVSYSSQVASDTRDENDDQVHIVWEGRDDMVDLGLLVMYQGYSSANGFTTATIFGSGFLDFMKPTITSLASGKLILSWHDGEQVYYAFANPALGEDWAVQDETYAEQLHPNLAAEGTAGPTTVTRSVSTGTSGTPYTIMLSEELSDESYRLGPQSSGVTTKYSRKAMVAEMVDEGMDSAGVFTVTLSPLRLKMADGSSTTLDFLRVNNRAPGTNSSTIWSQLATRPLVLSESIDSVFVEGMIGARSLGRIREPGWNAHRLAFEVVDARTHEALARIGTERAFTTSGTYTVAEQGRIRQLANREVYIQPVVTGMIQGRTWRTRSFMCTKSNCLRLTCQEALSQTRLPRLVRQCRRSTHCIKTTRIPSTQRHKSSSISRNRQQYHW